MKAMKFAFAGLAVFTALSAPVQAENTFAKPPKFWWPERIDLTAFARVESLRSRFQLRGRVRKS